ncbi:aldehyde dehydrogenase family protein, partial [Psychrobacter sp. TB20-MNA-CIBAN-0197]
TAEVIVEILKDAGLPDGVYNNVFATNDQAATIIEDSRIQGISLTGSERAGQAVAKIAGGALKKVVLELGGSDAFIVAADADIEQAV